MTIGIGVLCEDGNCAVLASDMRVSYAGGRRSIRPNDMSGKQWNLPAPFYGAAAVAGNMTLCQTLVDELTVRLEKVARGKIESELIEDAIDDSRVYILRRKVNWQLRKQLHITLRELHMGKKRNGDPLSQDVIERGAAIMRDMPFPVQLVIAGFVNGDKILFYRADRKEDLQYTCSPGIFVIGSGTEYALSHLGWRKQNADRRLPSTLLHVYEALRKARRDKGVGDPMAYTVVWKSGEVRRINPEHPQLRNWAKHYKRRNDTVSLDISTLAREQAQQMLQGHTVRY